jgi:glycosyltransferase 2 family protein
MAGARLFAGAADAPRARRATDVLAVALGAIGLLFLSLAEAPLPAIFRPVNRVIAALPDLLAALWQVAVGLLVWWGLGLLIAALVLRRLSVARDLALSAGLAGALSYGVAQAVHAGWPPGSEWHLYGPPAWYPAVQLAVPAAAIITASPHLTRPARRLGRWLIAGAALGAVALSATSILGATAGVVAAVIAGGVVHLVFGSSAGRPSLDGVRQALAELGVATSSLGEAERQEAGVFTVDALDADGAPIVVRVYGRDAYDTALVSTLWRAVWLRQPGAQLRLSRLAQVEHEALLTLLAAQAGIATDQVVVAGSTGDDDALLVLRRSGTPVSDCAEGVAAGLLAEGWRVLDRLHAAGVRHGQVDARHLVVTPDGLGLIGFRGGTVAPTVGQRRTDQAQYLATTALLAGPDQAIDAALTALGPERLTAVLPYLQPPALTGLQRDGVEDTGLDLDDLRAEAAARAGTEAPELEQLRRITFASVSQIALPVLAAFALFTIATGIDLEQLVDTVRDARWWFVAIGLVVAQLPRLSQAVSTMGAAPVDLPLGPVYALQLAVSYIAIAIPSVAARIAVNVRFFQRHGVSPTAAITVGAVDGVGGFVTQAFLLGSLLLLTSASLDLDLDRAPDSALGLLGIVVVLAVAAIAIVAAVRPWRQAVLGLTGRLAREATAAVRSLRSSRKLAMLFGGNLASEVLFAFALGAFARAMGTPVGLGELLVINISVGLLAGIIPIPGGVGVVEGGLAFGLVNAGMTEEAALAAVLLYRISVFYLPPVWGYPAFRWLQNNGHL